jgi:Na+/H+-dicarboxylate symporter
VRSNHFFVTCRIILVIVTTLGAVGASPIPNAGLVIIVSMWESVFPGVPMPSQISWIMSIDWLLDRCETTGTDRMHAAYFRHLTDQNLAVNVFGDSVGAAVIDHVLKASGDVDTVSTPESTGSNSLEFQNVRQDSTKEPAVEPDV